MSVCNSEAERQYASMRELANTAQAFATVQPNGKDASSITWAFAMVRPCGRYASMQELANTKWAFAR